MHRRCVCLLLYVVLTIGFSGPTIAGTIRDDRPDSSYLNLAGLYPSVGQFLFQRNSASGTWLGSGTLVAPNWVLTAGHVVDDAASMEFNIGGSTYNATNWFAYDKWHGDLGSGYDIGLVEFSDDISTASGIDPAQLYAGTDEVGKVATIVGYGYTGTGITGATTYDGQKRAGNNVVDALLSTRGKESRVLLTDFDNPNSISDSSWGSSSPLDLEYMIAGGDSGGGLFIDVGGVDLLAGVNSFGWGLIDGNPDSDYGDASGHTRVSSFVDWISSFVGGGGAVDGGGGGGKGGSKGGGGGGSKGGGRPFSVSAVNAAVPEPTGLSMLALAGLSLLTTARLKRTLATH